MEKDTVGNSVGYNTGALLGSLMRRTGISNFILGAMDVSGLVPQKNKGEALTQMISQLAPMVATYFASKAGSSSGDSIGQDVPSSSPYGRVPAPDGPAFNPIPRGPMPDPPGHFRIDVQDMTKVVLRGPADQKRYQAFAVSHDGDIVSMDSDDSLPELFARVAKKIEDHKSPPSPDDDDPLSHAA